ncbi:uncharacterized protein LOC115374962 [Myripristis murdjan]|uniref:uncharacterized protein LOC115374962 n=1 Tax=Myripristis murdjan TaxID=586833 RepID=UPI001175DCA5|nr:uncharacterized protein LOC115374962 [Myripristis murdjan]
MQQIYTNQDEHLEVFTTVFSPQACRTRARTRHVEGEKVVAVRSFQAGWPEELALSRGDEVQVVFKDDQSWWFGRLANGDQGYFPAACVAPGAPGAQSGDSAKKATGLSRRGSVPVAVATVDAPCGRTGFTPRLLRRNSLRRALGPDASSSSSSSSSAAAAAAGGTGPPHGSPSLLHRVLTKSRRKSCPHLSHPSRDSGSTNAAFQHD